MPHSCRRQMKISGTSHDGHPFLSRARAGWWGRDGTLSMQSFGDPGRWGRYSLLHMVSMLEVDLQPAGGGRDSTEDWEGV